MNSMFDSTRLFKKLLTVSAAGVLLGSVNAYAAGANYNAGTTDSNAQVSNTEMNNSQMNNTQMNDRNFSDVDQNQDDALVWTEIYAVYDDELADANWNEEQVFNTYDQDQNTQLDAGEYAVFVTSLAAEPVNSQAATGQGSQGSQGSQGQDFGSQDQAIGSQNMNDQQQQSGMQQASNLEDQQQSDMQQASTFEDQQQPTAGVANQDTGAQNQQLNSQAATTEEPIVTATVVTVAPIQDLSIQEIKDRQVINLEGETIGDVEDVVARADGSEAGLVVGVGGILGLGEKDVFVSLEELRATDNHIVWETPLNEDALKNLPEYNEDEFVSVPEQAGA